MSAIEVLFHEERPMKPEAVRSLYMSVGWWSERTEEQIASVLSSDVAIGAWDADCLVGFARVISDHRFHAYIDDVVVHPSYQRRGIGKLLLSRLVDALSHIDYFAKPILFLFMRNRVFERFLRNWFCTERV